MARIRADDPNYTLAADDLAMAAQFLDRCENFHFITPVMLLLLCAKSDAALGQIVRRKLHRHFVARQDTYIVHSHLARYKCMNNMTVLEFHLKGRIWQVFLNLTLHLDDVFLGHAP